MRLIRYCLSTLEQVTFGMHDKDTYANVSGRHALQFRYMLNIFDLARANAAFVIFTVTRRGNRIVMRHAGRSFDSKTEQ
jgi:hypothetical protein